MSQHGRVREITRLRDSSIFRTAARISGPRLSRQIVVFLLPFALLLSTWPQDPSAFHDAPDPGKLSKIRQDLPV